MKLSDIKDPYMLCPSKTADGKPWVQRCYCCAKPVNFLKDGPNSWVRVDPLVRHKRCTPPPYRGEKKEITQ
jgi:hypothetical protein